MRSSSSDSDDDCFRWPSTHTWNPQAQTQDQDPWNLPSTSRQSDPFSANLNNIEEVMQQIQSPRDFLHEEHPYNDADLYGILCDDDELLYENLWPDLDYQELEEMNLDASNVQAELPGAVREWNPGNPVNPNIFIFTETLGLKK
ncbi:hypothetical protein O0L34_g19216 [Tuta absoluta]|nr:hypothetical protein O0L34_g19216 [Tuta absoluta]